MLANVDIRDQIEDWRPWFAWRPVSLIHSYGKNPAVAWWMPVERRRIRIGRRIKMEYRLPRGKHVS